MLPWKRHRCLIAWPVADLCIEYRSAKISNSTGAI
jgi:hypothetical protein